MEVYALDDLQQIDRILDYTKVEVTERDLSTGAWMIEMPIGDLGSTAHRLADATFPGIELYDPDTGWRFGGFLRKVEEIYTEEGDSVQFSGFDYQSQLQLRLNWPDVVNVSNWWFQAYGGNRPLTSDVYAVVNLNCGPGALSYRRIRNMQMGPDIAAGDPKVWKVTGVPVLEDIHSLLYNTNWTARLHFSRWPQSGDPFLHFILVERPLSTTTLSPRFGTFGEMRVAETAPNATFMIAQGDIISEGADTRYLAVAGGATPTSWRNEWAEQFVNKSGTDDHAKLVSEAETALNEIPSGYEVQISSAMVDGYGADINLGWFTDVKVGTSFAASTVRLPVVGTKLTFDLDEGWKRTVDLGGEILRGPSAMYAPLGRLARRIRQIETRL